MTNRADGAARTRRRILQAAAELFSENGYGQTTLQAIADRAGVSVESVGLAGPKRRLAFAAFTMAFAGHGEAFPVSGEPAYVDLTQRMPLTQAIDEYLTLLAAAIARTYRLWNALRAAADTDPRAAAMLADIRAERRREFERSARTLADLAGLPSESVPLLVREFFAIASHEVYDLLATECGMGPAEFGDRLRRQLGELIARASASSTNPSMGSGQPAVPE
ncbi:TetR family transcriptional regulator [Microbacterium testaceum]|uniref:TetR family transcriptional regulator n=1 Tax=Microbacterium testaceum TaxID=2033 RepID=UPI000733C5FB|nr:helix-turn-helix domain-containing protein [Microbacterium testaceum]